MYHGFHPLLCASYPRAQKLRLVFSMHMARLSLRPRISEVGKDLLMNEINTMNNE